MTGTRVPVCPDDLFAGIEPAPQEEPSGPRLRGGQSLTEFAERAVARAKARKPRKFGSSKASIKRAREEMDRMAESGDWSAAKGVHLVALYAWLHQTVYGVEPSELNPTTWAAAAGAATRLVDKQFGGDYQTAVEFMRWTWKREQECENWRRANQRNGSSIGWRLQFGGGLVDRYRIGLARMGVG